VDHGKTSLVKALTGVDTDTLKEEKARGLSIHAGFAPYTLSSGEKIGFVDVPGHERFVKNMVRGVSGIDVAMLAVAADDGIMPQTTEHIDILTLLGIKHGVVVLTKADLVDGELMELAREEVREAIEDTFLEHARCIRFSALTSEGKEALEHELADLCSQVVPKNAGGVFALPIDRAFQIRGFGTVVTGTIASGMIRRKDSIEIYPGRLRDSARFLQVHGENVDEASAGQRVAVNIPQVGLREIRRGMVLGHVDRLISTHIVNAQFVYLSTQTKPLGNFTRVRFHTGASETNARMVFMDQEVIYPGQTALVQFRLSDAITLLPFDRYIVRCLSPVTTIGGGTVLEREKKKYKRRNQSKSEYLTLLLDGTEDEVIESAIKTNGMSSLACEELSAKTNISAQSIGQIIESLEEKGKVIRLNNGYVVYKSNAEKLGDRILKQLRAFHANNPLEFGSSKEDLRLSFFHNVDPRLYDYLLSELKKKRMIVMNDGVVSLPDFQISLTETQKRILRRIEKLTTDNLILNATTLMSAFGDGDFKEVRKVLAYLTRIGDLLYIEKSNLQKKHALRKGAYLHKNTLADVKDQVRNHIEQHGQISVRDMKKLTGTNSSCSGALLDHLDTIHFTLPVGENRILWKSADKTNRLSTGS